MRMLDRSSTCGFAVAFLREMKVAFRCGAIPQLSTVLRELVTKSSSGGLCESSLEIAM